MPGADIDFRLAVVDASVVVRWLVPEEGAVEAVALLAQPIDWIAPRLLLTEVASALRRKVESKELSKELALQGLDFVFGAMGRGALRLHRDEAVIRAALNMAFAYRHKVADCLYLALADHADAAIVTADRRLNDVAIAHRLRTLLLPSAEPGAAG
jgi:predicted nucleic acid-binding protein